MPWKTVEAEEQKVTGVPQGEKDCDVDNGCSILFDHHPPEMQIKFCKGRTDMFGWSFGLRQRIFALYLAEVVLFLASSLCFSQAQPATGTPGNTQPLHFIGMWKQPYFPEVMVASVFGWVLGQVKGFSGAKDWLGRYWTNYPKFVIFLLDLTIFVVCGAFFGTGIYNPDSLQAALAAGISWPVGLGALATTK